MTVQSFTVHLHAACQHRNGQYRTIRIKWWLFTFSRKYFICRDCCDVIPEEELPPDVWLKIETPVGPLFYKQEKKPACPASDMEYHREITIPSGPSLTSHNSQLT